MLLSHAHNYREHASQFRNLKWSAAACVRTEQKLPARGETSAPKELPKTWKGSQLMRVASRLSVPDFQLRPILEGEFGATTNNLDCTRSLTTRRDGHLCRRGLRIASETLSSALRVSNQVKWTVRPPYCGCQVTNATSCILRLRKRTRRVNMRCPFERQWRASYRTANGLAKRRGSKKNPRHGKSDFQPGSGQIRGAIATRFPDCIPARGRIQRPLLVQVCGRLWIGRKSWVELQTGQVSGGSGASHGLT